MLYFEMEEIFIANRSLQTIWNYTEPYTTVNYVDLGWNAFAISAMNQSVELRTFEINKSMEVNKFGEGSHFQKVYATDDDHLLFTVKTGYKYSLYFMPSILKLEEYRIPLTYEEGPITNLSIVQK
jgi:hypothetical protein